MEASEIIKRNEDIAKYLGWEKISRGPQNYTVWESKDGWEYPYIDFDEKWEMLMIAVEKITKDRDLPFHLFPPRNFGAACRFGMEPNKIGETTIEAVWLAVSDYVLNLGK